jgi:vancomycin resistance protein VanW
MTIVKKIKLFVKLTIRFNKDLIQGNLFKFATKRKRDINFNSAISLSQEIKPSESFENKIFNLSLASKKISEYYIMPNEIFSFWRIIGNPNYGFKKGRTILNGQIKEEVGGGICQVSGIVYNISLIAGLQILERYNHSVDIYTKETRFAPLGLDATVVFGYKDLRFKNNYSFPIKFEIEINENKIRLDLLSTQNIKKVELFFESEFDDDFILVNVLNENRKLLNSSKYRKNIR